MLLFRLEDSADELISHSLLAVLLFQKKRDAEDDEIVSKPCFRVFGDSVKWLGWAFQDPGILASP